MRVGALCAQRDLERHAAALAACPLLALALPYVGHVATRNRGTVGGSIAHADAAAELPLLLQTLGGEVEVTGPSGARLVPADEFFVSHLTSCLEPDEMVIEVRFPVTGAGWGAGFAEVAPRHGDYAVCAVACALRVADGVVAEARLGAAAVSDRPVRLARGRARARRARAASPRRSRPPPRRRARPSTRATACTPRPSTAATSPACSPAAAPSAPTPWRSAA